VSGADHPEWRRDEQADSQHIRSKVIEIIICGVVTYICLLSI
jgi:hypothetical protein